MDTFIDPYTRDYMPDTGARSGQLKRDPADGLANAVYLRIMVPKGQWWAAPTVGSMLYTLLREKDVARVRVLAERYAREALQPLLDDGRASRVDVQVEQPFNGQLRLLVTILDAVGQRRLFDFPVSVA